MLNIIPEPTVENVFLAAAATRQTGRAQLLRVLGPDHSELVDASMEVARDICKQGIYLRDQETYKKRAGTALEMAREQLPLRCGHVVIECLGTLSGIEGEIQPRRVYPAGYTSRVAYPDFEQPHRIVHYRQSVVAHTQPNGKRVLTFRVERLLSPAQVEKQESEAAAAAAKAEKNTKAALEAGLEDASRGGSSNDLSSNQSRHPGIFEAASAMEAWAEINALIQPQLWVAKKFKFPPGDWLFGLTDIYVLHFIEGMEGVTAPDSIYQSLLSADEEAKKHPGSVPGIVAQSKCEGGDHAVEPLLRRLTRLSLKAYESVLRLSRRLQRVQKPMRKRVRLTADPFKASAAEGGGAHDGSTLSDGGEAVDATGAASTPSVPPMTLLDAGDVTRNPILRKVSRKALKGHPG